jgi:hypothetical protein
MAVLVKPNGRLGAAYMAASKPFRYLFVYPALMRWIERDWQRGARDTSQASATSSSTAASPSTSRAT